MSSTRPPHPHHALLDLGDGTKHGLLLETDQRGVALIGKKVQSLANVVPNDALYGKDDIYRERSFAMRRLVLGMGERVQSGPTPLRYRYARNCWFAGGLRGKGPKWNALAPASTGSITDFAEALNGGVVTQFILAGRYVLIRGDDTSGGQTVSHDFGVARTVTSWARFKEPSGTDRLYVTLDNGDLWHHNGAAWAGPVAAAGTWNGDALLCAVTRDEFWIVDGPNTLRKATLDPTNGINYSGQFFVGDGSVSITGLAAVGSTLVIFTNDGRSWTLNGDGSDNDLAEGLKTSPAATNGSKPAVWVNPKSGLDAVYFRNGASWRRLTVEGGANVEPVGPERLISNDSPVSGQAVAFAGYGTFYGYFATYNSSSGASHLLQFGDWIPRDDEDGFGYVETFNGALVEWASRQVTAMRVQYIGGVPRLYVGFSDGTFGWIKLPQNTPNPFSSTSGCFPGDTRVEVPSTVTRVSKRLYVGDLIKITTAGGNQLAGTPNHPILTDRGWVALGALTEEDYVVSHPRRQEVALGDIDAHHRQPTLGQVFDLAERFGTKERVAGSNKDFHGDGQDGNVEVVTVKGGLLLGVEAALSEPIGQHRLTGSHVRHRPLVAERTGLADMHRHRLSAYRFVGRGGDRLALLWGKRLQVAAGRLALRTGLDAQPAQVVENGTRVRSIASREALGRFASGVALDKIVIVKREVWRGHVYNLETRTGMYAAEGIVAHNCEFADGGTGASECYWPTHTMLAEVDQKQGLSFAAFGPTLDTSTRVTIARALDGGSFSNLVADLVSNGAPTSLEDTDVYRAMDVKETYVSPSSASTPVIESVVLREQLRPASRLEYSLTVDANPNRALRNGGVNRATPDQTHGWIRQAADAPGASTWTLPDETVQGLTAVDYGEAARLPGKSYGSAWDLPVKLIQFKTVGTYGIYQRFGTMTYADLGTMTYEDAGVL